MRRNPKVCIPIFLALLLSVFAPEQIERVRDVPQNGTTLEFWCFDSPLSNFDPDGVWRTAPPSPPGTAGYSGGSDGVFGHILTPAHLTDASASSALASQPAWLPNLPTGLARPLAPIVARLTHPRGPPLPHIATEPPSLRGPPVA